MSVRFVILHHQTAQGEHWDLMLEHGDTLLAWQLPRDPTVAASTALPATRLADHRKRYLDYEGPISGGRGRVRRVDRGAMVLEEITEERVRVVLKGKRLDGVYTLTLHGDAWLLQRTGDR